MDRVRKISYEVLEKHRDDFGTGFKENKTALETLSIVRSKSLKNKIAGRITRAVKKEIHEKEEKERREKEFHEKVTKKKAEDTAEPDVEETESE